jgi:hypothetical protein
VTLAERLLPHVLSVSLPATLPPGVEVLDPFHGEHAAEVRRVVRLFHERFYADDRERVLMLGINPGRLGAGSTGLPFTDTKRCEGELGIRIEGFRTHEPSSDFFFRVLRAAGGAEAFFSQVYVHSICPLGLARRQGERRVNLNYYDDPALQRAVTPVALQWLRTLIGTGMRSDVVLCLGIGKNLRYLEALNAEHRLFGRIVPLAHPRFVIQYRAKQVGSYVRAYLRALKDTQPRRAAPAPRRR